MFDVLDFHDGLLIPFACCRNVGLNLLCHVNVIIQMAIVCSVMDRVLAGLLTPELCVQAVSQCRLKYSSFIFTPAAGLQFSLVALSLKGFYLQISTDP